MTFTRHFLEFNGQEFRVIEVDELGERRQVGYASPELNYALRSAVHDVGDLMLVIELKVAKK